MLYQWLEERGAVGSRIIVSVFGERGGVRSLVTASVLGGEGCGGVTDYCVSVLRVGWGEVTGYCNCG